MIVQGYVALGVLVVFLGVIITLVLRVIDARFGELLATMTGRFDAVDSRFDAVDTRFTAVDQRLDSLDRDVQALTNQVFRRP